MFVSSVHLLECMLSPVCALRSLCCFFSLLVAFVCSSGVLYLLRCIRRGLLVSAVNALLSSSLLYRFSLSSERVRFLLRLSCLSLVVVFCAPGSFFALWVSFPFLLFVGFHCLFFASLVSVIITFGSPEVSFVLFDLCSGLLRFSILHFHFFRCGCARLQQFRVSSFLFCLLRVCQRSAVAVDFPCFLSGFFLVSFLLRESRLSSPEVFSVSTSFCFARLSVITRSSPVVGFVLVLPSCGFCFCVLFFLTS